MSTPETKEFSTAAVVSASSGMLFCDFGDVHEFLEYLMGHPIWTHQFVDPGLREDMLRMIAEQFPGMPTALPEVNRDNYLEVLAGIEQQFGKTLTVRKGHGLTAMLPTDGLPDGSIVAIVAKKSAP